ncbi:hypothetical protein DSL72_003144 [Monilinia vaccinii-corymbosi]|uniref:BTB domain-containing protein n=1 Tax=Monilinia vaccinii-corymbosi TaxID=61207 RepID=A0A8A3NSF9_9HELO|nr:hypothetical protein DSL72_003144 [Monilinia vaccinii-corymbosi]
MATMDEGVFAFESDDDDDYQTSNGKYGDETENKPWERRNVRQVNPEERTFSEIPADQFLSKTSLFSGPTVKIFISTQGGSKQQGFNLSKALLCARSTFFDRAFNGSFKEAASQEMHLSETPLSIFQLVVQFLYTNSFVFPTSVTDANEKLNLYLCFFKTCHQLHITGLAVIISRFKKLLKWRSERGEFPHRFHMEHAMDLPVGHEARRSAVAACVIPYAYSMTKSSTCYGRALFHLESLVEESSDFAADLLRAYTKAVRGSLGAHTILDPLTMTAYRITTGAEAAWDE